VGLRGKKTTAEKLWGGARPATWEGDPPWQKEGLQRWQKVVAFIECLPITSGKLQGQKMRLRPWQKRIIRELYRTNKGGKRLVRQAILTFGRKNGKTQLAAALVMAHLGFAPEAEPRGQIFSAALDRIQASLIFDELEAWIYSVPEFTETFNVVRHIKRVECLLTGSVYQALSRDSKKAHGLSPSFIIADEVGQWPDSQLWDNLTSGMGARAEPLAIGISTQAPDDAHFFSQLVDYGRKQKTGELPKDPSFLLVDYSAPPELDIYDPKTWKMANPALGDFRDLDDLKNMAELARKIPAKEMIFRNLFLNQRCSAEPRFIAPADWLACQGKAETTGACYFGLDLASVRDLTALVGYWPDTGAVRCWTWLPGEPSLREKAEQDRVPYDLWERQGFIQTFDGRATNLKAVAIKLIELCVRFDVRAVAYDRWRIEILKGLLSELGGEVPLQPWGQGYRDMSEAIDGLERLCIDHSLACNSNPVLTWCISNVKVLVDPAGGRKFDKGKSETNRIDAAQALAMAIGIAGRDQAAEKPIEFDFEYSLLTI
jgi:phage terminase large subunit-like protein